MHLEVTKDELGNVVVELVDYLPIIKRRDYLLDFYIEDFKEEPTSQNLIPFIKRTLCKKGRMCDSGCCLLLDGVNIYNRGYSSLAYSKVGYFKSLVRNLLKTLEEKPQKEKANAYG